MIKVECVKDGSRAFQDFLELPKKIYPWNEICQNNKEEMAQLTGKHPLSSYYDFKAYVGYLDHECVIRGALAYHYESQVCYLGYFESYHDDEIMACFIDKIRQEARSYSVNEIIGPVDASFWLGYRMKLSNFHQQIFTGEPHNLNYYPSLWEKAGFELIENYYSYYYAEANLETNISKAESRYQKYLSQGVKIIHPSSKNWQLYIDDVLQLVHRRFSNFPTYHPLNKNQFQTLLNPMKKAMNFSYLSLAYDQEKLVGLNIGLPNYGNLTSRTMKLSYLIEFIKNKYWPKQYILMYLAADREYPGLGLAMLYPTLLKFKSKKIQAISALIHEGKATAAYLPDYKKSQTHYGLFRLII